MPSVLPPMPPLAWDPQTAPLDAIEAMLWEYEQGYMSPIDFINHVRAITIETRI